jgi:hypothetical protein
MACSGIALPFFYKLQFSSDRLEITYKRKKTSRRLPLSNKVKIKAQKVLHLAKLCPSKLDNLYKEI